MLGFSPFKKHANKFHYVPRYYDPEKEARELRRAELRGERAEDAEREYRPGQYIRTQRDARAARRERDEGRGRMRVWKMLAAAAVAMFFISLVYPRLAEFFLNASRAKAPAAAEQIGDFDPSAPITIVPNDYQE